MGNQSKRSMATKKLSHKSTCIQSEIFPLKHGLCSSSNSSVDVEDDENNNNDDENVEDDDNEFPKHVATREHRVKAYIMFYCVFAVTP